MSHKTHTKIMDALRLLKASVPDGVRLGSVPFDKCRDLLERGWTCVAGLEPDDPASVYLLDALQPAHLHLHTWYWFQRAPGSPRVATVLPGCSPLSYACLSMLGTLHFSETALYVTSPSGLSGQWCHPGYSPGKFKAWVAAWLASRERCENAKHHTQIAREIIALRESTGGA